MKLDQFEKTEKQCTSSILMIRPAAFGFNKETAVTNAFQHESTEEAYANIQEKAVQEFDELVSRLKDHQMDILVVEDTPTPSKPDAIFPNNWITMHADGSLITYPMHAAIRRFERRADIIDLLSREYKVQSQYSFDHYEEEHKILEGTGSMILDRSNHIVYACLSPRTDQELLEHFALLKQYQKVIFYAKDTDGIDVYHTNVIMALGERQAIICLDCIQDQSEKERVIHSLRSSMKEIIEISWEQVLNFAGNMLQVCNRDGEVFWVMSQSAYQSLHAHQIKALTQYAKIISSPIPTIEYYGGGSVRCMMAEIFLPKRILH